MENYERLEDFDDISEDDKRKILACVIVEQYIDQLDIAIGEDGKFFAYISEDSNLSELQVDAIVECVETVQSELGGL